MWEILTKHQCLCGEGPVWDDNSECIFWVDILSGEIHRFSATSMEYSVFNTGEKIGAIALRSGTGLIAALKSGFYEIDFEKQQKKLIVNPEEEKTGNRFNDGKCDAMGRFWAGTMDDGNGISVAGALYVLDKDGTASLKIAGLSIPNGIAWSLDHKKLYHIDTPSRKVVAFDFDLDLGSVSGGKVVIQIPDETGLPDGMTVDADGMLWIAHWDGGRISRWDPNNGSLLHEIHLPVSRVTSCTFGGEDLTDIYITSARTGLSNADLQAQPLAGSLFVIRNSGFKGVETSKFKG